jgi:hypothetical protein
MREIYRMLGFKAVPPVTVQILKGLFPNKVIPHNANKVVTKFTQISAADFFL